MEFNFNAEINLPKEKIEILTSLVPKITEEILSSGITLESMKRFSKNLTIITQPQKASVAKALAWALCTPSKFYAYYDSFSDAGKEVIKKFAYSLGVQKIEFTKKILGKSSYYVDYGDLEKLPFGFIIPYGYTNFLALPPATKKCVKIQLSPFFQEENLEISDEDFKNAKGYFSEDDGLAFFLALPQVIQVLADSGFFDRATGSTILKGHLLKIAKIAFFKSFTTEDAYSSQKIPEEFKLPCTYSQSEIEKSINARLSLALAFLSLTVKEKTMTLTGRTEFQNLLLDPKNLLRSLIEIFFSSIETTFDQKFLYPHISIHQGYYTDSLGAHRSNSFMKILSLIKNNPPEKPIRFSDYISALDDADLPTLYSYRKVDSSASFFICDENWGGDSFYITKDRIFISRDSHYNDFVQMPALTNLFLTLSSLGLFEITWENPCEVPKDFFDVADWKNHAIFYPYGKIGYIKMTPLGAYAFSLTNAIEIKGLKKFAPPKFSEDSLIIHIDQDDKSTRIFLEPFCVPLSRSLFKADEAKLKKNCKTKSDVKSFFSILDAKSENPLPKIWEELKKNILKSFVSLKGEIDWVIFPLEKQDEGLIRTVEKLSKQGLCFKMEGKRVAVKEKDLLKFKKKIEAAGFKLEQTQ